MGSSKKKILSSIPRAASCPKIQESPREGGPANGPGSKKSQFLSEILAPSRNNQQTRHLLSLRYHTELLEEAYRHRHALVAYAFGIIRDWHLAEDAVHNAFLVVQRKESEFDRSKPLFPWLRAITRFQTLQIIEARRREIPSEATSLDNLFERYLDEIWEEDVSEELELRIGALGKCIREISDDSRELLYSFYIDGKRGRDLLSESKSSGKLPSRFWMKLYRLRKALRLCLEKQLLPESKFAGEY